MRFVVIIGLLLSFVVLARGALQSWEEIKIPPMPEVGERKKPVPSGERQSLALNPQVPALMPELRQGYLFNEERLLAEEAGEEAEVAEEVPEATSALVNMESLTYVGSIIIGDVRKGLVSFSVTEPQPTQQTPQPRVRAVPRAPRESQKYASVSEEEEFYDFRVAQILPEKIVFAKGEAKVEKLLYDPEKERSAPAMPARARRPVPGQMPVGMPGGIPGQTTTAGPQPARPVQPIQPGQPIPQPETNEPGNDNANPATGPTPSPRIRPTLPPRPTQRPQVIQRRRLPVQPQ